MGKKSKTSTGHSVTKTNVCIRNNVEKNRWNICDIWALGMHMDSGSDCQRTQFIPPSTIKTATHTLYVQHPEVKTYSVLWCIEIIFGNHRGYSEEEQSRLLAANSANACLILWECTGAFSMGTPHLCQCRTIYTCFGVTYTVFQSISFFFFFLKLCLCQTISFK